MDEFMNDREWDSRKDLWVLEQRLVASEVEYEPDPEPSEEEGDENVFRSNSIRILRPRNLSRNSQKRRYYGGVDVSFPKSDKDPAVAVYVIVDMANPEEIVYSDYEYFSVKVPYVPSFLAFREIEPLERLVKHQLEHHPEFTPQAILVDGNGVFHVRHAGIACFMGVRTNIPTIGVAKSLYYQGGWTRELVESTMDNLLQKAYDFLQAGVLQTDDAASRAVIIQDSTIAPDPSETNEMKKSLTHAARHSLLESLGVGCCGIGYYMRSNDMEARFPILGCALVGHGGGMTSKSVKSWRGTSSPIFVSVGHKTSLQEATIVCASLSRSRIPEPVRQADLMGRSLLRKRSLPEDS